MVIDRRAEANYDPGSNRVKSNKPKGDQPAVQAEPPEHAKIAEKAPNNLGIEIVTKSPGLDCLALYMLERIWGKTA